MITVKTFSKFRNANENKNHLSFHGTDMATVTILVYVLSDIFHCAAQWFFLSCPFFWVLCIVAI